MARLDGTELIADFIAPESDSARHMIRERWTMTNDGLAFALEANTEGRAPQRVGGFIAARQ